MNKGLLSLALSIINSGFDVSLTFLVLLRFRESVLVSYIKKALDAMYRAFCKLNYEIKISYALNYINQEDLEFLQLGLLSLVVNQSKEWYF